MKTRQQITNELSSMLKAYGTKFHLIYESSRDPNGKVYQCELVEPKKTDKRQPPEGSLNLLLKGPQFESPAKKTGEQRASRHRYFFPAKVVAYRVVEKFTNQKNDEIRAELEADK